MGQTASLPAVSAGSAGIGINIKELEDLSYEKSLSSARFMKCIRARQKYGLVVVKVAMRPFPGFKLDTYIKAIRHERDMLADVPNALGYQRVLQTESSGYLVRQYLYSSLYDRMSTRPFLEDIEKKWIAYQLLCAVRDCHSRNVYHGDIKTENVLVTSWNWVFLTDFSSSFKKTYLPEDNPADFSFFFDTSGRRTCYLAPERFLSTGEQGDERGVTWAMDVFSVGCVIAELFLESPIFSLSQLFEYRKGESNPDASLKKIDDKDIRELILHMIQLEPESRYSAEEYLNFWRHKAFPEYFYSFLHPFMGLITDPSSGHAQVMPDTANFGEADDRIDRVYHDFDKISYFLNYGSRKPARMNPDMEGEQSDGLLPLQVDLPNHRHPATMLARRKADDGTLIFLTLVLSSLRNTARATAKIRACDLLLGFAERVTDESKLDRILPYLVLMLNDASDAVKIAALRSVAQLLALVSTVSPVNANVFTEYIRPRLQNMIQSGFSKTTPIVRATYAACLASIALSSAAILELVQALRADGSIPMLDPEAEDGTATDRAYRNLYDVARFDLIEHFEAHTKALLTDTDASVRRALLGSISSLCVFFGSSKSSDVILSHLNTYLNEKDWMLKSAFFQTIVGVATFIGSSSFEDFVLPLMWGALTDPEEFVVAKVISSFASMAELGLFQRSKTWEMVDIIARFMVHPNLWIREAAAHFVAASTEFISVADTHCIILPLIRPYLKVLVLDFRETTILDALKRPLARPVLDMAFTWATRVERGVFWRPLPEQKIFSFSNTTQMAPWISSKDLGPGSFKKVPRNEEDEQWLSRLRNIGMTTEDEFKLLALRDHIRRTVLRKPKERVESQANLNGNLNSKLMLKEFNVVPQTVFFDHERTTGTGQRRLSLNGAKNEGPTRRHTIADALLDASTTVTNSLAERNRSLEGQHPTAQLKPTIRPIPKALRIGGSKPASSSPSPTTRNSSIDRGAVRSTQPRHVASSVDDGASDGASTPGGSGKAYDLRDRFKGLTRQSSAINLLNRKDVPKALALASTDATNAAGTMDSPFAADAVGSDQTRNEARLDFNASIEVGHNYHGDDPTVTRLLDDLAAKNFPLDLVDFGPSITPITSKVMSHADDSDADLPWRPQGIHVATFGEHTGPINRVLPSPDHLFFITASDDGTVKVWDTQRLERNLVHRSRQTHRHAEGAKVTCITFVENTHTFVSCATDGSIQVLRVDCTLVADSTKYARLRLKRDYSLPPGEYAIWCEHYRLDMSSVLVIATNISRILALDLRNMTTMFSFVNAPHHGSPTCFCIDPKRNWLLLATTHGVLDLWDLRFHLHLRSWSLSSETPIHRLQLWPFKKSRGKWVCVAGGTAAGEVTVWDVEKVQCVQVFRTSGASSTSTPSPAVRPQDETKAYQAHNLDDQIHTSNPLARFTHVLSPPASTASGIRGLAVGSDAPHDGRETRYAFMLTGGPDRRIRFWDLVHVDASLVVSGLELDEPMPRYTATWPTPGLVVNAELLEGGGGGSAAAVTAAEGKSGTATASAGKRPTRPTVMKRELASLLRAHLDEVMDVAILERPVGMTVSVDRAGCIYVFQ